MIDEDTICKPQAKDCALRALATIETLIGVLGETDRLCQAYDLIESEYKELCDENDS